jgi:hypothetical protein
MGLVLPAGMTRVRSRRFCWGLRACVCALARCPCRPPRHTKARGHTHACIRLLCARVRTRCLRRPISGSCVRLWFFLPSQALQAHRQTRYTPWQVGGLHATSDAAQSAALCRRPMVSLLVQLHSTPLSTVEHHTHTQVHARSRWWTTFAFTHARMRTRTHASIGESLVNHRSCRNRRRLMPSDADRCASHVRGWIHAPVQRRAAACRPVGDDRRFGSWR